jgi:hypothetical protein
MMPVTASDRRLYGTVEAQFPRPQACPNIKMDALLPQASLAIAGATSVDARFANWGRQTGTRRGNADSNAGVFSGQFRRLISRKRGQH